MNQIYLKSKTIIIVALSCLSSVIYGQKPLEINVYHSLNGGEFELYEDTKNNIDIPFRFSRFDYYISNITIHYDQDQSISYPDIYVLVRDAHNQKIDVGFLDFNTIDSISFLVGVDSVNNHADPTLWPEDHALAPSTPDMHWGWAAGYRFAAIEGTNGPMFSYIFQLHPLGLSLLQKVTIPIQNVEIDDLGYNINILAECEKSMKDIDLTKVIYVHGSTKEAITVMRNLKESVFSELIISSTDEDIKEPQWTLYPNPTHDGKVWFRTHEMSLPITNISITDVEGKEIYKCRHSDVPNYFELLQKGVYFVNFINSGRIVASRRIVFL